MPVSVGRIRVLGKPEDGTHCGETSITSSFANEASFKKMIRINKLVRTAHEVSATPVSHQSLSDPVFVTFHDAGLEGRKVSSCIHFGEGGTRDFGGSTLANLSVQPGMRGADWKHGRRGNHVRQIGLPGNDKR